MQGHHLTGWFALQTLAGRERIVAEMLRSKAYEVFLPLCLAHRQWRDRVKRLLRPLLPGYVFCRVNPAAQGRIVTTPGVVRIVAFGGMPAVIPEAEMESIRRIADSGLPAGPCVPYQQGTPVRLVAGPLQGLEGIVTQVDDKAQLIVEITLLQRAVAVRVELEWVEPRTS